MINRVTCINDDVTVFDGNFIDKSWLKADGKRWTVRASEIGEVHDDMAVYDRETDTLTLYRFERAEYAEDGSIQGWLLRSKSKKFEPLFVFYD